VLILGAKRFENFGRIAPREFELMSVNVIASAAKQSILSLCGTMDCFAEPVIGRAFARPVGSQ
jgi:hypothetical protein